MQDFIMSSNFSSITDWTDIVAMFVTGSISSDPVIQRVSANALSFLVTHRIVYKNLPEEETPYVDLPRETQLIIKREMKEIQSVKGDSVLDAVMHLSGSEQGFVRATAFSILSSLSLFSSKY